MLVVIVTRGAPSLWFWRRCNRLFRGTFAIRLFPCDPPLPAHADDTWEDEEQEETSHQGIAAHQPPVVPLAEVKVRRGVHLDQQRSVSGRQDTEKDTAAQEQDTIVLADTTTGVSHALRSHDLEWGKEPADALLPLAVGEGLGRDVRQDQARIDG